MTRSGARPKEISFLCLPFRSAHGGAAVVATHSMALAQKARRVVKLEDGRVISDISDG
jgi:ABC-type lipoprotein export system ATPase subunit